MSFDEDFNRGVSAENKVLQILRRKYPSATLVNGYSGYDIWVPEKQYGVEVKFDPKSKETGNVVIEIEMSGKPSALFATEAAWWVFYDGSSYAWIKPRDIFWCIIYNKLFWVEFTGSGDKNPKKAFLLDKRLLFTYAKTHGEMEDIF